MVVDDFNFVRALFRPVETQAVLLIDADAELANPTPLEQSREFVRVRFAKENEDMLIILPTGGGPTAALCE